MIPINTKWTPERTERLKVLVADGETASVIANELGVTRNSVIGKVHRMNLDWKGAAARLKAGRTKRAPVPKPERKNPYRTSTLTPPPQAPLLRARTVSMPRHEAVADMVGLVSAVPPPPSGPCTLVELRPDSCRWPLWDASATAKDFFYCNEWSAEGQSYCANHRLIAYAPGPTRPISRLERIAAMVED